MEVLGYTHAYAAYEEAIGIEYELPNLEVDWKRVPGSACAGLLGATLLCSSLNVANPEPASARLYANTPSGSCLRARTGPGTGYRSVTCVRDGARLAVTRNYRGNWVQLSTGRWVYAPYTSIRRDGPRGYVATSGGRARRATTGGSLYYTIGSTGSGVRSIQRAVGARADGGYGANTEAAVRRFQRRNGLTADGIAGPRTLAALGLG